MAAVLRGWLWTRSFASSSFTRRSRPPRSVPPPSTTSSTTSSTTTSSENPSATTTETKERHGLSLFFEDQKPFKEGESPKSIPTGRSWRASELRTHTFEDLHKLWYVLLRERNLLMTQKHDARVIKVKFTSPGRLLKVKKSMARIKTVIHERTTAFQGAQLALRKQEERRSKLLNQPKKETPKVFV